jgi:hypothetical protein
MFGIVLCGKIKIKYIMTSHIENLNLVNHTTITLALGLQSRLRHERRNGL